MSSATRRRISGTILRRQPSGSVCTCITSRVNCDTLIVIASKSELDATQSYISPGGTGTIDNIKAEGEEMYSELVSYAEISTTIAGDSIFDLSGLYWRAPLEGGRGLEANGIFAQETLNLFVLGFVQPVEKIGKVNVLNSTHSSISEVCHQKVP